MSDKTPDWLDPVTLRWCADILREAQGDMTGHNSDVAKAFGIVKKHLDELATRLERKRNGDSDV